MKIVQINATSGIGSTGRICVSLSELLNKQKIDNYILYSLRAVIHQQSLCFSNEPIRKLQSLCEKIFGNYGCGLSYTTYKLISKLNRIKPDIIHLHNIHSHDCNFAILFDYIRKHRIKVFWTFHDCWAFTGYCSHYDLLGCQNWKSECHNCPIYKEQSYFLDRSNYLFREKIESYGRDLDLTIITPSQWLANQVSQSFLSHYPVKVINNGIDLSVFKRAYSPSVRSKLLRGRKYLILGVSFGWSYKKGLDVFNYLSRNLGSEYQVVLVGLSSYDNVDSNIVKISKTKNISELAEIYSVADVFVNATREDTYPTVNMEAIACGTPVVTFDAGGSAEIIGKGCGRVVRRDDNQALIHAIKDVCKSGKDIDALMDCAKSFDQNKRFKEYLNIYNI